METYFDEKLEKISMELAEGCPGVFNVMFREGKALDAYPRLSGAHIFTTKAGVNIPSLIIKMIKGETLPKFKIKKIRMFRAPTEIIKEVIENV